MKLTALATAIVLVSACGQKGALYLPKDEQKQEPQTEQTKQSDKDKKNIEQ